MPALTSQGHSLLGDRKCSNVGQIVQTTLSRTVLSVKQRALREERVREDFCPSPCSLEAFTSQGYGEGSWKDTGHGARSWLHSYQQAGDVSSGGISFHFQLPASGSGCIKAIKCLLGDPATQRAQIQPLLQMHNH